MEALLDGVRKNPDIVAVLVLCLALGLGRTPVNRPAPMGIYPLWQPSVERVVDAVTLHLPRFVL